MCARSLADESRSESFAVVEILLVNCIRACLDEQRRGQSVARACAPLPDRPVVNAAHVVAWLCAAKCNILEQAILAGKVVT